MPAWWNTSLVKSEALDGPVAMMLSNAVSTDQTLMTGSARGLLEEDDEKGQQDFLKALAKATNGKVVLSGGPIIGRGVFTTWMIWDAGVVIVEMGLDGKINVTAATTEEAPYLAVGEVIGEHLLPEHVRQPVYALSQVQGDIGISEVGAAGSPLEAGNYDPAVIKDFQFIVDDLQRKQPFGRLALIEGQPGTGKTWFVRGIINEVLDAVFILIPSHVVEDLAGPQMIPMLLKARGVAGTEKPLVLVIEDADRCLRRREVDEDNQDKEAAISAILNLSDGIIGQSLDLRIIATTNLPLEKIDEAAVRPGRLSKHTTIGTISAEQCAEVYERLTEGETIEFDGPHTVAQVYAQAFVDQLGEDEEDDDEEDTEDDDDDDDSDEEDDDE
jgi:hypothetical protein